MVGRSWVAGDVGEAAGSRLPARVTTRAWRRWQARRAARALRHRNWRSRGQTLIFFALSVTVLVAILGLAIDTIRIYDLYARMQRAAEAGALAAVLYMPNYYSTNLTMPPADNAICRALQETIKDGFGQSCGSSLSTYCPSNPATVEVAICPVTGKPHDLVVYITESSDVIFLSAVNVGPVTVTVKAQAEYLPPVQIGADTGNVGAGYFGGFGGCASAGMNPSGCASAPQSFVANINGPAELKEQGDPYVNCEEGPAHVTATDQNAANLSTYTGYNAASNPPGLLTNHQQYSTAYNTIQVNHCGAKNTDQQPTGFSTSATSSTSHPGGYTYLVNVTQAGAGLWIYNASYIPTNGQGSSQSTPCTGAQQIDQFAWYPTGSACTQGYYQNYGVTPYSSATGFTASSFYFNTRYTLYSVPNITTLTAGSRVAQLVAPPYDGVQADLTAKGCAGATPLYDPQASACVAKPPSQFGWTQLASNLSVGQYRLEVEATGVTSSTLGWGQHGYGLRLCPSTTTQGSWVPFCIDTDDSVVTAPGNISALGAADMTLIFPPIPAVTAFPLAIIPTEYAGRTVQVSLFDAGDPINAGYTTTPNTAFYIMPPQSNGQANSCSVNASTLTGYTFHYPTWATYTSLNTAFGLSNPNQALITSQATFAKSFNGIWAPIDVTLPPSYTQGQWTLCSYENVAYAQDTLAVAIAPLGQSPAHLV